jgi:fructose 1,6-bisphosphatase
MGDVIPIGRDTYTVNVEARGGVSSNSQVRALALKRANEYCLERGTHALIVDSTSGGVRGFTPQEAEVQFQCLREDDPAYKRNHLEKTPDTVIRVENRN